MCTLAVPVAALTANFSPMPRSAPPPRGRVGVGGTIANPSSKLDALGVSPRPEGDHQQSPTFMGGRSPSSPLNICHLLPPSSRLPAEEPCRRDTAGECSHANEHERQIPIALLVDIYVLRTICYVFGNIPSEPIDRGLSCGSGDTRGTQVSLIAALVNNILAANPQEDTCRHRLNRYGDRDLNQALHHITITRERCHAPTRDYVARRTTEGKTRKEILRCLVRKSSVLLIR